MATKVYTLKINDKLYLACFILPMEEQMEEIINVEHLSKSFGSLKAVDDLSLSVHKGELYAFLGINGADKSTTINILCGQLSKDQSKVFISGHDLDKDRDLIKRKLGVVFQNSVLDSKLSVYDNLVSRASLYGIKGQELKDRLEDLSELLDFGDIRKNRRKTIRRSETENRCSESFSPFT